MSAWIMFKEAFFSLTPLIMQMLAVYAWTFIIGATIALAFFLWWLVFG